MNSKISIDQSQFLCEAACFSSEAGKSTGKIAHEIVKQLSRRLCVNLIESAHVSQTIKNEMGFDLRTQ